MAVKQLVVKSQVQTVVIITSTVRVTVWFIPNQ